MTAADLLVSCLAPETVSDPSEMPASDARTAIVAANGKGMPAVSCPACCFAGAFALASAACLLATPGCRVATSFAPLHATAAAGALQADSGLGCSARLSCWKMSFLAACWRLPPEQDLDLRGLSASAATPCRRFASATAPWLQLPGHLGHFCLPGDCLSAVVPAGMVGVPV